MPWQVTLSNRAEKQVKKLPVGVKTKLYYLMAEIERSGPVRGNWANYGMLDEDTHHCHIKKGQPCYVAVWKVTDKEIRLIEVKYVGTHEKAPY